MAGNVWEWVADWYADEDYQNSPSADPTGPDTGAARILRGGSWDFGPGFVRVSYRAGLEPAYRDSGIGFRCAGEVLPEALSP